MSAVATTCWLCLGSGTFGFVGTKGLTPKPCSECQPSLNTSQNLDVCIKFSLLAADARRRRAKAKGVMFDHLWDAEGEQLRQADLYWQQYRSEAPTHAEGASHG